MLPSVAMCDPADVTRLENALTATASTMQVGVGVVDTRTGEIRLFTYDETDAFSRANPQRQVMAGHEAAATMAAIPLADTRGFALGKSGGVWYVYNQSHLNRVDGQSNTMQMAPATFALIVAALVAAGVLNPVVS